MYSPSLQGRFRLVLGRWFGVIFRMTQLCWGVLPIALGIGVSPFGLSSAFAQASAVPASEMEAFQHAGFDKEYLEKHYTRLSEVSWFERAKMSWEVGTSLSREEAIYYIEFWPATHQPLGKLSQLYALARDHGAAYLWPPNAVRFAHVLISRLSENLKNGVEFDVALEVAAAGVLPATLATYYAEPALRTLKSYYKGRVLIDAVALKVLPAELARFDPTFLNQYGVWNLLRSAVPAHYANLYLRYRRASAKKVVGDNLIEGTIALWQQSVKDWDLKGAMPNEDSTACALYGRARTKLVKYDQMKFNQDQTANPIPLEVLDAIEHPFHGVAPVFAKDFEAFGADLGKLIDPKVMAKKSLPDLLRYLAKIVGDKVVYEEAIDDKVKNPEFLNCSLKKYWDTGRADCDKYAALYRVVFSYAKALMPFSLKNYYMTNAMEGIAFHGHYMQHEWNTLVHVGSTELTITMLDPTFADNSGMATLDAMNPSHIDQKKFLTTLHGQHCF